MRLGIIGRSELMYKTAELLSAKGYEIALVITSKAAPEYKFSDKDFEAFATKLRAVYLYTPNLNLKEHKHVIDSAGPIDLIISVNYTGVISQDIINVFRFGILNAHAGDLPRYRGNAAFAWALINNENRVGLCVHKMKGGELDSGDIIARDYKNVTINTRIGELYDWMEEQIPVLMLSAVERLEADNNYVLDVQSKDPSKALRCYPRKPEDGKINWSESNETILRLINASSEPFSGAFGFYNGEKFTVWRAELYSDEEKYCAVAGQVCAFTNDGALIVACGSGKLLVTEVEINNERTKPRSIIKSLRARIN